MLRLEAGLRLEIGLRLRHSLPLRIAGPGIFGPFPSLRPLRPALRLRLGSRASLRRLRLLARRHRAVSAHRVAVVLVVRFPDVGTRAGLTRSRLLLSLSLRRDVFACLRVPSLIRMRTARIARVLLLRSRDRIALPLVAFASFGGFHHLARCRHVPSLLRTGSK